MQLQKIVRKIPGSEDMIGKYECMKPNLGSNLHEGRWNGGVKCRKLSPAEMHIWASSTLYTHVEVPGRKAGLNHRHSNKDFRSIFQIHLYAGAGHITTDLCMKRDSSKTLWITSMEVNAQARKMRYRELEKELYHEKKISFQKSEEEIR